MRQVRSRCVLVATVFTYESVTGRIITMAITTDISAGTVAATIGIPTEATIVHTTVRRATTAVPMRARTLILTTGTTATVTATATASGLPSKEGLTRSQSLGCKHPLGAGLLTPPSGRP